MIRCRHYIQAAFLWVLIGPMMLAILVGLWLSAEPENEADEYLERNWS